MPKLKKLEELIKLANDGLTKEDFTTSFKIVIDFVKRTEKALNTKIDDKTKSAIDALTELQKEFNQIIENAKNESDSTLAGFKRKTIETINAFFIKSRVNEKLQEVLQDYLSRLPIMDAKIEEIDNKLANVKDGLSGKDANEEKIVQDVLAQIKLPEQKEIILDGSEEIRDKLETLEGEERLDIEAIKGLKDLLEEIKQRPVRGGGGFSKIAYEIHIIDDETPTGTPNGVLTDFVLNHIPNPTSSLKVYLDGQRMRLTTDYTFAGKTITFLSAPLTGSVITADYRI